MVVISDEEMDKLQAAITSVSEIEKALKYERTEKIVPCTLSMSCFRYDALLEMSENNAKYVIDDIDYRYLKMFKAGATTFWETEKGAADFDGAGSLCHGWSAMPVYYYNLLKDKKCL